MLTVPPPQCASKSSITMFWSFSRFAATASPFTVQYPSPWSVLAWWSPDERLPAMRCGYQFSLGSLLMALITLSHAASIPAVLLAAIFHMPSSQSKPFDAASHFGSPVIRLCTYSSEWASCIPCMARFTACLGSITLSSPSLAAMSALFRVVSNDSCAAT